jgi:excisionase family DNA binding protein
MSLSVQTLYKWRSEGKDMPHGFTIGNRVRFYEDDVDAWMAKRSEAAKAVAA